jgi:hypothetical protein
MQIQIKLFSVGGTKNHVVMIARGLLNANGLKQIFRELAAVTIPCVNCKVLIDVIDAEYKVKDPEIDQLLHDARSRLLPRQCKTALRSSVNAITMSSCRPSVPLLHAATFELQYSIIPKQRSTGSIRRKLFTLFTARGNLSVCR